MLACFTQDQLLLIWSKLYYWMEGADSGIDYQDYKNTQY